MIEEAKVRTCTKTKVRPKMVWDMAGPNTNRFESKIFLSNIDDFQMEMKKEIKVRGGGIFSYKSRYV